MALRNTLLQMHIITYVTFIFFPELLRKDGKI